MALDFVSRLIDEVEEKGRSFLSFVLFLLGSDGETSPQRSLGHSSDDSRRPADGRSSISLGIDQRTEDDRRHSPTGRRFDRRITLCCFSLSPFFFEKSLELLKTDVLAKLLEKRFHSTTKLRSVRIIGDANVLSTDTGRRGAWARKNGRTGKRSALIGQRTRTRTVRVRRGWTHVSTALTLTLNFTPGTDQERREEEEENGQEHRTSPPRTAKQSPFVSQRAISLSSHLHQED